MIRKLAAVCGDGRPGKVVGLSLKLSANSHISNRRFAPVRYSTRVNSPMKAMAIAQTHPATRTHQDSLKLDASANETLARINVRAVFGII
jgi:hypothetical protein